MKDKDTDNLVKTISIYRNVNYKFISTRTLFAGNILENDFCRVGILKSIYWSLARMNSIDPSKLQIYINKLFEITERFTELRMKPNPLKEAEFKNKVDAFKRRIARKGSNKNNIPELMPRRNSYPTKRLNHFSNI